jgi:hypothetical protein
MMHFVFEFELPNHLTTSLFDAAPGAASALHTTRILALPDKRGLAAQAHVSWWREPAKNLLRLYAPLAPRYRKVAGISFGFAMFF